MVEKAVVSYCRRRRRCWCCGGGEILSESEIHTHTKLHFLLCRLLLVVTMTTSFSFLFFMKEHAKTLCISTMLSCWNIQNINSLHFVCYWRVECCWDFDMRQSSILLLSQRHWPWWQWICVLYAAPATFIYFFYFGIYNFAVSSCCSWSRSRYSTVPMSHSKAQSRLVWECVIRSFMREEWILLEK